MDTPAWMRAYRMRAVELRLEQVAKEARSHSAKAGIQWLICDTSLPASSAANRKIQT